MMNRNHRGISMRVRLAVAATVLVGGGAAGVVVIAGSHGSAATAQSAGYTTTLGFRQTLSETKALSSAMNSWDKSPSKSLTMLAEMKPMSTFSMTAYHAHTLAVQRGTVVATARDEFVIKSSNRKLELWHVTHGTKLLNVGGSRTGMAAMTGGTMAAPAHMNTWAKTVAKNDLVFIFGERVHGELVAQLVLYVAPVKPAPKPIPTATATPTATASASATATSTAVATPSATASPTATAHPSVTATPDTTVSGTPAAVGTSW
jgi:hypothetical protein